MAIMRQTVQFGTTWRPISSRNTNEIDSDAFRPAVAKLRPLSYIGRQPSKLHSISVRKVTRIQIEECRILPEYFDSQCGCIHVGGNNAEEQDVW